MGQLLNVTFDRNETLKTYSYYYDGDDAEAGDLAVVISPYSQHTLTFVQSVDEADATDRAYKKVHTFISLKSEREAAERERKAKYARQQLEEMLAKRSEIDKFAALADDPRAQELIATLKELEG